MIVNMFLSFQKLVIIKMTIKDTIKNIILCSNKNNLTDRN